MIKFNWTYRYVNEGQLEPDEFRRWAIDGYMFIHIDKALPKYQFAKQLFESEYLPVRVATIFQKGCKVGSVPSLIHQFCAMCPSFEDGGNTGLSNQTNFFSNDIEELKQIVENEFNHIKTVFENCKTIEQSQELVVPDWIIKHNLEQ